MGLFDFLTKKKNDGPITTYGIDTGDDLNNSNIESFNWETNADNSFLGNINFYLKIEDKFTISGRGTVIVGRIESGSIKIGDKVYLKNTKTGEIKETSIVAIEMFRKNLDTASAGDNVGIFLSNILRREVNAGDILYKE